MFNLKIGKGEAIYRIGVADKGLVVGLNKNELDLTMKTIDRMIKTLNATYRIYNEINVKVVGTDKIRKALEILIKEKTNNETLPELRIAVLGETNVGKSSLISILTQGVLDNGHGLARSALGFRHRHELLSGHTSSILREIYGYSENNEVINYNLNNFDNSDNILNTTKYLVTMLDLAGSRKHLKTTIYGLICNSANFAFLVINATTGLIGTAKEHLEILLALNRPFLIVLNKIDLINEKECVNLIHSLKNLLNNRILKLIHHSQDIDEYFITNQELTTEIPLIKSSCLTGQSISLIYKFVNRLPIETPKIYDSSSLSNASAIQPFEFLIEDVFHQNDDTCVIGGILINGQIKKNDRILIGPTNDKQFIESKILSIQRYKVTMNCLNSSESGSLEIELNKENNLIKDKIKIRKGMIVVSKSTNLSTIKMGERFKVKLNVICLKNSIKKGFQAKIYVDNIKQSVFIERIEVKDEITCIGQYYITLKLIKHPEIIRIGSNFFLHEDSFKATGRIVEIC